LGEVSKILLGIQTGKDLLFIGKITKEKNGAVVEFSSKEFRGNVETDLLKPLLRGRNVRKWNVVWFKEYVLCPHYSDENFSPIPEKEMREKFTNTYEFLKSNKEEIKNRLMYGKTAEQRTGVWYSLMYFDYAKYYNQPKILTPALTDKNNFALDTNNYFFVLGTAGVYGIIPKEEINIKYLLGILNSKISEYFLKKICPIKQGGYFQYSTKFLERLPIKIPETEKEKQIAEKIIKKVEEILELQKKFIDLNELLESKETEKLYKFPSVSFHIKEGAEFKELKLEKNRIYINSDDFVEIKDLMTRTFAYLYFSSEKEELKKAKDVKNLIYNIPVPKSEEVIKEIISLSKDKEGINEKNKKLEKEINELVYKLYGITKEEKGIIEGV